MERSRKLVDEMGPRYPFPIRAMESLEAAVIGAEIVVTVTNSSEPVVRHDWIAAGTHVNAVGACIPSAREIDSETVAASKLFVDKRESILQESGDYLFPLKEGAIRADHISAEIGEVLIGIRPGRESGGEITLFKSLGLAVEDLAAAEYIYRKAKEKNQGTRVEF
jgi:ornithine cyclodeaminase